MVNRKRKNESGAATAFISRGRAIKLLQLSLQDFRKLCILKGIYPQEPKHFKKVGKGSSEIKTYYTKKDIVYLKSESIINKFREHKIFVRKLKKAVAKKEGGKARRLRRNKPVIDIDHIVKERYPTLVDAVRDLDDCLSLCFLFACMPKNKKVHSEQIHFCQRLTMEFMKYVVSVKGLRKVFYAIQGIYYQAEIMNQTVTWVVRHKAAYEHPTDVDYRIMSTFVEFYCRLLGFVNFALFTSMGASYPPQLTLDAAEDTTSHEKPDEFNDESGDQDRARWQAEQESVEKLKSLFKGLKFFINREVDRESLVFHIRSCGGEVSWDSTVFPTGVTFTEDDEKITHHVIDRKVIANPYLSRSYVQPQWVADCINNRRLLPVKDYYPGASLPPHLSPFVEEGEGDYVPPEKRKLMGEDVAPMVQDDEEDDEEDEGGEEDEQEEEKEDHKAKSRVTKKVITKQEETSAKVAAVTKGEVEKVDAGKKRKRDEDEEKKLAEMMISKKDTRLYRKIKYKNKKDAQEAKVLQEKREKYEKEQQKKKKRKLA